MSRKKIVEPSLQDCVPREFIPPRATPALIDSEWVEKFRELVAEAYAHAHDLHDNPPLHAFIRWTKQQECGSRLKRLHYHLMDALNRPTDTSLYVIGLGENECGEGCVIHGFAGEPLRLRCHSSERVQSIIEALAMFKEIERRQAAKPNAFPLCRWNPLQRLHGLLAINPTKADPPIDQKDKLGEFIRQRYHAGLELKKIAADIDEDGQWGRGWNNDRVGKELKRYSERRPEIKIEWRKPRRNRQK